MANQQTTDRHTHNAALLVCGLLKLALLWPFVLSCHLSQTHVQLKTRLSVLKIWNESLGSRLLVCSVLIFYMFRLLRFNLADGVNRLLPKALIFTNCEVFSVSDWYTLNFKCHKSWDFQWTQLRHCSLLSDTQCSAWNGMSLSNTMLISPRAMASKWQMKAQLWI